jgi:hypothetical protein
MNAQQGGSADILTRTTLQMDGSLSPPSIANVVHALQRVPGVLLAEINAAGARAVVAHDSAVSTASLLAAAAGAGERATIVADRGALPISAGTGPPFASIPIRRLLLLVAALALLQAFIGALSPSLAKNHVLLPILLAFLWAFVLFSVSFNRRT